VTVEDLVEEIVGEIVDEHDATEPESVELPDGSYRLDGSTHLEDLEEIFPVRLEEDRYETVGGLVFGVLGHIPQPGESIEAHGLRFVVEQADDRRVQVVRIFPAEEEGAPEDGDHV
jgi:CBS domain containing-hemolysin-like protein